MTPEEKHLLLLLEKPYEDLSVPRGKARVVFDLHDVTPQTPPRIGVTRVSIPERPEAALNKLGSATIVPLGGVFSFFIDAHRKAAHDLRQVFMETRDATDLMQVAARVHGKVNEGLFIYALSFTIIHRRDLRAMRVPSLVEIFPNKFVPQEKLTKAQNQINKLPPQSVEPVIIDYGPEFANTNIKAEHHVSYWREDYGLNSHHYHWHLVYPSYLNVQKDRKGELFFYMHQQMLARYDMERLSVGLNRVLKLGNWREPIPDGYFSKLTINNAGRAWGTRQDNTTMKDFRRNDYHGKELVELTDMELWQGRIMDAIHQGFMVNSEGNHVPLSDDVSTGKRGIDILGDAIEADADLSVNSLFYGNIHNIGHMHIAFAHDPYFAHKEEQGVMGDNGTAMRDPTFYRWHRFIDDLFQEYKLNLSPYTIDYLSLPGVVVQSAEVRLGDQVDNLRTGWSITEFETGRGLDFGSNNPVKLKAKHIDNEPFSYQISVNNEGNASKQVTVRIFLAPKHDERGNTMTFMDQRLLWAEMDKFTFELMPGYNHIQRSSMDSSVTISKENTFRDLEDDPPSDPDTDPDVYCGCGWPQHMLVPRGKPEGMAYELFIMITDYEEDKVLQASSDPKCGKGVSYCGVLDGKYPDSRPMGFPFDRRPPPNLTDDGELPTAVDLAARLDNMLIHDITITFTDQNLPEVM